MDFGAGATGAPGQSTITGIPGFQDPFKAMPLRPQDEIVLDDSIKDMNEFLDKLNKFEKITNSRLVDLWQIKDTAFQPLRASIDV
jgi:hypothetical protein